MAHNQITLLNSLPCNKCFMMYTGNGTIISDMKNWCERLGRVSGYGKENRRGLGAINYRTM